MAVPASVKNTSRTRFLQATHVDWQKTGNQDEGHNQTKSRATGRAHFRLVLMKAFLLKEHFMIQPVYMDGLALI